MNRAVAFLIEQASVAVAAMLIAPKERAELLPLATCGSFTLYERAGRSSAVWLSLKLVRTTAAKAPKKNWWFGWDGKRLSNSSDCKKLAEHHPGIRQWVIDVLRSSRAKAAS